MNSRLLLNQLLLWIAGLASGLIVIFIANYGLQIAKRVADVEDCGTLSDSIVLVLSLLVMGYLASAINHSFRLPLWWTLGVSPVALFVLALFCVNHGYLTFSWLALQQLVKLSLSRSDIVMYLFVFLSILLGSLLPVVPNAFAERLQVSRVVSYLGLSALLLMLFITMSYTLMVGEVRMSQKWARLLSNSIKIHNKAQDKSKERPTKFDVNAPPPSLIERD